MEQTYITLSVEDATTGQTNSHHELQSLDFCSRYESAGGTDTRVLTATINSYKDKTEFDEGDKTPIITQVTYTNPTAGIDFTDGDAVLNRTTITQKIAVDWGGVNGDVTVV